MAVISGSAGGSSELEVLALALPLALALEVVRCLFVLSVLSSSAGLFCADCSADGALLELELEVEAEPEFELLAPALE